MSSTRSRTVIPTRHRHLIGAALTLAFAAGCASSDPYAPPPYTASSCSGPSSYAPVQDGMNGAGRGAVIGAVTGNVARSVVMGTVMAVGSCLDSYAGP